MSNREQLTDIFNNAHISTERRSELLSNAFELIFYRDPSLLEHHYGDLIHFALDRSASIKKIIISFIEQICKKYPNQFNHVENKAILLNLLNDQNKSIVKRTILCIINITKSILSFILQSSSNQIGNEVYNDFNELKQKIVQIHSQTDDESIKTNTFKFLEILVLSFTSPGDFSTKKLKSDEEFCLDKVPLDHSILSRTVLQQEGDNYLQILLDSARDLSDMTSTNIMILITSLTNILRQRFSMMSTIIPVICSCPNILPKLQTVQNESVKHSFKTNLLSIIRLKHSSVQPFIKTLIEAASLVDAKEHAEEAARWYRGEPEKKKRQYSEQGQPQINQQQQQQPSDQTLKKLKTENDQLQNNNQQNYVDMPRQHQELPPLLMDRETQNLILQLIRTLPSEQIIDIILENFSHVPLTQIIQNLPFNPITEKLFQFVNSYQNLNQQPIPFSIYNNSNNNSYFMRNQQYNNSIHSPPLPPLMPNNFFSNSPTQQGQFIPPPQIQHKHSPPIQGGPIISPPGVPPTMSLNANMNFDPRSIQQPLPQPTTVEEDKETGSKLLEELEEEEEEEFKPDENEIDEDEVKFEEKLHAEEPPQKLQIVPIPAPEVQFQPSSQNRSFKPIFSHIKPLSPEVSLKMCLSAFDRVKKSEPLAIISGNTSLWTSILAKMISVLPNLNDNEEGQLIDFILEQFQSRKDLALQWLQNELFIQRQITLETDTTDRYNNLLSKIFEKMKSQFTPISEQGNLICSFILELPLITDQLLDSILSLNTQQNINNNHNNISDNNDSNNNDSNGDENTLNGGAVNGNEKVSVDSIFESTDDDEIIFKTGTSLLEDQWSMLSLKILRDIVIWRPIIRKKCLNSLLEFSISPNDKLSLPTIKLISNQLYSKSSVSEIIKEFAKDQILNLLSIDNILEIVEKEQELLNHNNTKDTKMTENTSEDKMDTDKENQEQQDNNSSNSNTNLAISNELKISNFIERKLYLFFSLCTKNYNLITDLLEIYPKCKEYLQQIIQKMVSPVIKKIGQSNSSFLHVLSICPEGSQSLMIEILKSLVENDKPSLELVATVKKLITIQDDPRFLLPIVNGLEKEEVITKLPVFITQENFKQFVKVLASPGSPISPSELLVQLHMLESNTKRSMEAIDYCFEMTSIFKQEFMAVTIQQLIILTPLPKLLMRTIIKTLQIYPRLKQFIVEILHQLVRKQIWNDEGLWSGFILCAKVANPESLHVVLQLPTTQFKLALQKDSEKSTGNSTDLKTYLSKYLKAKTTNPSIYPKDNIKALNDFVSNTNKNKDVKKV